MQTVVMTKSTLKRLDTQGKAAKCQYCDERFKVGELANRRRQTSGRSAKTIYAHRNCEEKHRIE
jgi:hypothetical protein